MQIAIPPSYQPGASSLAALSSSTTLSGVRASRPVHDRADVFQILEGCTINMSNMWNNKPGDFYAPDLPPGTGLLGDERDP